MAKTVNIQPWSKVSVEFNSNINHLAPERQQEVILSSFSAITKQNFKKRDMRPIKERIMFWGIIIVMFMLLYSLRTHI